MTGNSRDCLGAKVILVSSCDDNHPQENIVDGNRKTFWMSTGMFPQEFVIQFPELTTVSGATIDSFNVKRLKVESSTAQNATQFNLVTEKVFESTEGHLQSNEIPLTSCSAIHLRFIIISAYDHFVSIHKVGLN